MISPQQHNKLMKKYMETGRVGASADKAGIDRKTARRYVKKGVVGPGEKTVQPRQWRTHRDPFKEVWGEVEQMLGREPRLQAKTIFAELQRHYPGKFGDGQKRTLERRVRVWKEANGPTPVVNFSQEHRPAERMQLDWTHCNELEIKIAGRGFPHLLVHAVFPFSNWEWARVCRSESYASLRLGMQSALWEIGGVPKQHQTDQSSTATHARGRGKSGRDFNTRYLGLCVYYGMEARVIGVAEPEQNGDVESLHRHLKSALEQALLIRGSREFATEEAYEDFVFEVVRQRNAGREKKVAVERAHLGSLPAERLPEFDEVQAEVNREGIVRAGKHGYSTPARWVGKKVRLRLSETRVEIYSPDGEHCILSTARVTQGTYIDWRHVIVQLLRKPGAFERWRYRESMYPGLPWRKLYDRLRQRFSHGRAEREYLRILALALEHPMEQLEEKIEALGAKVSLDGIRQSLGIRTRAVIDIDFGTNPQEDLAGYDRMIGVEQATSH